MIIYDDYYIIGDDNIHAKINHAKIISGQTFTTTQLIAESGFCNKKHTWLQILKNFKYVAKK